MKIDRYGWLVPTKTILIQASPNFNPRPNPADISLLVVHNISLPPGRFGTPYVTDLFLNRLDIKADPWFACLEGLKVSAHFFIDRRGVITQFVSCNMRAWHAGASSFEGRAQCNDFSLGIELEGTDTQAYTQAQYRKLITLTKALQARYPLRAVQGHCHIAPARKTDPGPFFDWGSYTAKTNWAVQPSNN